MAQTLDNLLNANIETVRKGALPMIYQMNKDLAVQRVCGNSEQHRITKTTNGDDFRAPIQFAPPGNFGVGNLDGGALGLGTGFNIAQFLQTFFTTKMGFQMTYASIQGTATTDQSVLNAWQMTMQQGLPNMARYEDAAWHNLGGDDGQVGVATAFTGNGTGGVYTLDTDIGARMFIPNQPFEIINGATWKTGQTGVSPDYLPFVSPGAVDYASRQITFTCPVTLTGGNIPAAGDVLYFAGATPAGTPTFLQGLKYVNTTTTSGNYLGLSRTTYPSINSSAITTGGNLTPAMVLELIQLIRIRQGNQSSPKLIGLVDPHQIAVMNSTVQAMQQYYRTQVSQSQIDPLPGVELDGGIIYGGVTHHYDALQSASRIDYVNTADWLRVYYDSSVAADFYRNPGNNEMFFPLYSSSNGGPSASVLFYLISTINYANLNPANSGLITDLTLPSGYSY